MGKQIFAKEMMLHFFILLMINFIIVIIHRIL